MAVKGYAEVAGGVDWGAGTADIMDYIPDGSCRCLFEGRGIEIDKMAQGQLPGVVAINTDQTQAAHVKIMFAGKIAVELVRGLQDP